MDIQDSLTLLILIPLSFLVVLIVLPFYVAFKLFNFIKRCLFEEDVRGKVVLITGASSGIGEQLAYEYAKRGALLSLIGRRKERLDAVAETAHRLGSPEVIKIGADVSDINDSQRFVQETLDHFGRLDHLVNNAGILITGVFDQLPDTSCYSRLMDVNFWGTIHGTRFALPHLKKTKGKIIIIASTAARYNSPRFSFYGASKAAVVSFFETPRTEMGDSVGITIVTPGLIRTAMTEPFINSLKDKRGGRVPMESAEKVAKAIVRSGCRGDMYLTVPVWWRAVYVLKVVCPELVEFCNRQLV